MELRIVSKKSSTISLEQFKKMRNDWREQIALLEIQQISYWKSINNLELAYKNADKNKYVVMTLRDKKMRYKFKTANNVILIGSGMYPYSLFDLHKQYPHIKSVGIEIDKKRAIISKKLVKASPAKNAIKIITIDAIDFDYSWLSNEDFVFISVDVKGEEIYKKILETSKAQPLVCAPYKDSWMKSLVTSLLNES